MSTTQFEQTRTTSSAMQSMQSCVDICNRCAQICLQTAMNQCLEMGGRHVEPDHFRLMMNCAEICEACVMSCDSIGNMEVCASVCQECSDSCKQMASMAMH